jgi:hypothetical protein
MPQMLIDGLWPGTRGAFSRLFHLSLGLVAVVMTCGDAFACRSASIYNRPSAERVTKETNVRYFGDVLRRIRIVALLKVVVVGGAFVASQALFAASAPPEYSLFRSVCSLVEFEATPQLEGLFDRNAINKSVSTAIEARLHARGLSFPVEFGRQCFRRVISEPRQLTLWFYASLTGGPDGRPPIIMSLVVHSFYQDLVRSPHEFPTKIMFCLEASNPSECLADHVVAYFDATVLGVIASAQGLRRGGAR